MSLLSLGGLSPFPLPSIPAPSGFWHAQLPAAAPVVKTAPWEGNPLKGAAAGVILVLIYGLEGAGRSVQVSGRVKRKKISIVGRKGNLMGELIGLF